MADSTGPVVTTAAHRRIESFLRRCPPLMAMAADEGADVDADARRAAREAAAALDAALDDAEPVAFEPSWLPCLDSVRLVATARATDDPAATPFHDPLPAFADLARDLPWVPTPRASDGGAELALAPLDRVFDTGSTMVGIMYVAPGCQYPVHRHPPQELYLVLGGRGRWRYGGSSAFRTVEPLQTVYNHPDDLHSVIAGDEPVVALYVLWP